MCTKKLSRCIAVFAWFCFATNALNSVDPVQVGHERIVSLGDRDVKMTTLAVNPPIFHIHGFLTENEADSTIREAETEMENKKSFAKSKTQDNLRFRARELRHRLQNFKQVFKDFDLNHNRALEENELGDLFNFVLDVPNHDHSLFMQRHGLADTSIKLKQFKANKIDLVDYAEWIQDKHPHTNLRHSDTVLLKASPGTRVIADRALRLTQLPSEVFFKSLEHIQVLHYSKRGHYGCHLDSGEPGGPIQRVASIALFLQPPRAGGELAFPGADHPHADEFTPQHWFMMQRGCQPTSKCTAMGTGIIARPRKGDAIFWYNINASRVKQRKSHRFVIPPEANFLNSFHCGAAIEEGEKWMANVWMNFSPQHMNLGESNRNGKRKKRKRRRKRKKKKSYKEL